MIASLGWKEPEIMLPGNVAKVWRVLVIVQASYTGGLMLLLLYRGSRIRLDKGDLLVRPVAAWVASYLLLSMFVVTQLFQVMDMKSISLLRTPMAFVGFFISNIALSRVYNRFISMIESARNGTYKLTITDTSKPGPDIDLSNQEPIC